MVNDSLRDDAIEFLWEHGRPIKVVNWDTQLREDNTPERTNEQTLDWRGEVVVRGSQSFSKRADGISAAIDAMVWVPEEYDGTTPTLRTGERDTDTVATQIRVFDDAGNEMGRYDVEGIFREQNGRVRLHTSQKGSTLY